MGFGRLAVGVVALGFVGCTGTGKIGMATFGKPPSGWQGSYLTDPETFASGAGKGFARLTFTSPTQAQLHVIDHARPDLQWLSAVTSESDENRGVTLRCRSLALFKDSRLKANLPGTLYTRTSTGAEKWIADPALREEAEKFMADEGVLAKLLPSALRRCDTEAVRLDREMLAGGRVALKGDGWRLFPQTHPDYATAVDRLPEPAGDLEPWKGTRHFPELAETYESKANAYLPLPQSHKIYRLATWVVSDETGCSLTITPRRAERPHGSQFPDATRSPFLYRQLERARWIAPKVLKVTVIRGTDRQVLEGDLDAHYAPLDADLTDGESIGLEVEYEGNIRQRMLVTYGEGKFSSPTGVVVSR